MQEREHNQFELHQHKTRMSRLSQNMTLHTNIQIPVKNLNAPPKYTYTISKTAGYNGKMNVPKLM